MPECRGIFAPRGAAIPRRFVPARRAPVSRPRGCLGPFCLTPLASRLPFRLAAFADTRNNDPRNGLALTPDAHWSFDEGLWTIDDALRVVVARGAFAESSPTGPSFAARHGRPLHFAPRTPLRPAPHSLAWHREHRFVGN